MTCWLYSLTTWILVTFNINISRCDEFVLCYHFNPPLFLKRCKLLGCCWILGHIFMTLYHWEQVALWRIMQLWNSHCTKHNLRLFIVKYPFSGLTKQPFLLRIFSLLFLNSTYYDPPITTVWIFNLRHSQLHMKRSVITSCKDHNHLCLHSVDVPVTLIDL